MANYTVKQGDCICSIAYEHGLFWETVWNHAQNSKLKQERKDPNILCPGDEVFVPDKEEKVENKPDSQKHPFKINGVPSKLRIRLLENDEPLSNVKYTLVIDGEPVSKEGAKTNNKGILEHFINPAAKKGELSVGEDKVEYILHLGCLDPIEKGEGVQGRLKNLGHYRGKIDGNLKNTAEAIRQFQQKYESDGLTPTGTMDDKTRDKLKAIHGN